MDYIMALLFYSLLLSFVSLYISSMVQMVIISIKAFFADSICILFDSLHLTLLMIVLLIMVV